eukprot:NODE_1888_length_1367_cov_21.793627_g1709_i0.p1 GENE.NODE_1888_length_1367_cov_21.793627_g1709_i0~~NODE_1888_length_1367_cov_21.793627_g1709_i0.p1  ORF type:complete len:384 (-),score=77.79 NODE_1888_length_1367_cov_21.793627_g1709_i0:215-1252(-)
MLVPATVNLGWILPEQHSSMKMFQRHVCSILEQNRMEMEDEMFTNQCTGAAADKNYQQQLRRLVRERERLENKLAEKEKEKEKEKGDDAQHQEELYRLHSYFCQFLLLLRSYLDPMLQENSLLLSEDHFMEKWVSWLRDNEFELVKSRGKSKDKFGEIVKLAIEPQRQENFRTNTGKLSRSMVGHMCKLFLYMRKFVGTVGLVKSRGPARSSKPPAKPRRTSAPKPSPPQKEKEASTGRNSRQGSRQGSLLPPLFSREPSTDDQNLGTSVSFAREPSEANSAEEDLSNSFDRSELPSNMMLSLEIPSVDVQVEENATKVQKRLQIANTPQTFEAPRFPDTPEVRS